MKSKRLLNILFVFLLIFSNVGCDQISKQMVRDKISYGETISVIGNQFIITKVENTGAFLSLGESLDPMVKNIILTLLPCLVMLAMLVYILRKPDMGRISVFAICCILGGGLGNIFDRALYGSVTDFLHMDFYIFRTGIFNLADVSIMFGVGLIIMDLFLKRNKEQVIGF